MTSAGPKGAVLRRKLGLTGRVVVETVAEMLGLSEKRLPLVKEKETEVDGYICIDEGVGLEESLWYRPFLGAKDDASRQTVVDLQARPAEPQV